MSTPASVLLAPATPFTGPATASVLGLGRRLTRSLVVLGLLIGLVLLGPVGEANAAKKGGGKKGHHSSRVMKIERATKTALNQLGDPYRYGSAGPNAFDCSGLIHFSFRKAGVSVPRTSGAQAGHTRKIKKSNLKRGDLMFFHSRGRVYHAAIFLGRANGRIKMLHAPGSGKRVERSTPWTSSWFAGTLRGR
jgi:cell wall-associated NlpC family hydrolase